MKVAVVLLTNKLEQKLKNSVYTNINGNLQSLTYQKHFKNHK